MNSTQTQYNRIRRILVVVSGLFAFPVLALATPVMAPLKVSTKDVPASQRWLYGEGLPKGSTLAALMAAGGKARLEGQYGVCLKKLAEAWPKAKEVQPWILAGELECASQEKAIKAAALRALLTKARKHKDWFFMGPQARALRSNYFDASLVAIEADIKNNRTRASKQGDELMDLVPHVESKQQARFWFLMGELMFLNQKNQEARELLQRSLTQSESSEARARLAIVDRALGMDKSDSGRGLQSASTANPEISPEEAELSDRITAALKSGDLVTAVSDAVTLIREFPGGTRAKWAADRVYEAYNMIADKTDSKLVRTRSRMLKEMRKADTDRLVDWARAMFRRGQWEDALTLSRRALESLEGPRMAGVLDLAAKCALAMDRFDVAGELLGTLVLQHSGTPAAREALLRLALVHYRLGKYAQASSDLERLLAFPESGRPWELTARYWLWRSLQQQKSPRADQAADTLLEKFPFSYYGLRARLERYSNALEWKEPENTSVVTSFWLTAYEKKAFERARTLLEAGWLDEAQQELNLLPSPKTAEDKALWSLLWASAGNYVRASRLANEAWDERPEFRRAPFMTATFPQEFTSDINRYATARQLDHDLVRSLIKQESGFNTRATSPANALGLMQLMPLTAKEVAQDLKLGALAIPDDLFKAPRNIQMGTYYLSRMVSRYQGHVPLALAAYNAGPTRLDRWLKTRASLEKLMQNQTSLPEAELWIDEIPYLETSIYVKSILRNLLMYKMLDIGRVQVVDPIWSVGKIEKPSSSDGN